jgi:hypothetical protein
LRTEENIEMSDSPTPRLLAVLTLVVGITVPLVTMADTPLTAIWLGNRAQGSYATTAALGGSYAHRLALTGAATPRSPYSHGVGIASFSRPQGSYSQNARLQGPYSERSQKTLVAGRDASSALPSRAAGLTILFAAVALGVACLPTRKS